MDHHKDLTDLGDRVSRLETVVNDQIMPKLDGILNQVVKRSAPHRTLTYGVVIGVIVAIFGGAAARLAGAF